MNLRRFMTLLVLVAALPAGGQTKFVFSPQWTAQAQFAGYYAAKELGFYAEEGLDVEIVHPFATQSLESRVREGNCQAYSMFLTEAMDLMDDGIKLVNILQTSMNSSLMVVSRYGTDPSKLVNPKIVSWRAGFSLLARAVSAREGYNHEPVIASSVVNLFVVGAVQAALATSYNEYFQLLQTGLVKPDRDVYRFSDHGYNIQEDGVYMTLKEYNKNRESAERFARASRRGWDWVAEHQEEALGIVMEYVKEFRVLTNETLQHLMLEEILRLQLDPDSGQREFRLREDMVRQASDLMVEADLIENEVTIEQLLP